MPCDECVLLLEEYSEQTRRYQRSVAEYREAITRGFPDEIQSAQREVDQSRTDVRDARITFQQHKSAHVQEHRYAPTLLEPDHPDSYMK
jgi:hypothetical protein